MQYDFSHSPSRLHTGAEKWRPLEDAGITDPDIVPLSIADMELPVAPEITQALVAAAQRGTCGYTMGDGDYRAAVCAWMETRHGWQAQPDWLVTTFGVVHAMLMTIHAFTQAGDGVIYQPPVYPPFRQVIEDTGRRALENPLKRVGLRYEMDYAGLEALCKEPRTKLLLLCSPHNPVGRVWSREELGRMADICRANNVLIFSDEIHFDFVYPPHKHTVLATLGEDYLNHMIVATSTSKTFNLAGLTTANIFVPDPEKRARFFQQSFSHTGEYNGYFGVTATQAAYAQGGGWLDALLPHIWGNYEYCKEFLHEKFPGVVVYPLEGTYLLWADFSCFGLTPPALEQFMVEEAGLYLDEGYIFGPLGDGYERINLACARNVLEQALGRLEQAAQKRGLGTRA